MEIVKQCLVCGATFVVPHWRPSAKYCSTDCQHKGRYATPNTICTNCGKPFHMKQYQKNKTPRSMGYFCSKQCTAEYRKTWFKGENNHQYGLKGSLNSSFKGEVLSRKNNRLMELKVYVPYRYDADKHGRVTLHRLIVEENWRQFNPNVFNVVGEQHILKKGYEVHHIDGNHNNNAIDNLAVLTKDEHRRLHNARYYVLRSKKTGRYVARVILPPEIEFEEADTLSTTDRGEGGYGSTGK